MFFRYDHDGYGQKANGDPYTGAGVGGLWPIFSGERGEYELANGRTAKAMDLLKTMAGSASAGFMIPEQVFSGSLAGQGPFAFAKAQDR
jgi:glucoamylase